jgi:hypothetical protein
MSLKPFSASVVPEQTASVARRAFPKGSLSSTKIPALFRHNRGAAGALILLTVP